MPFFGVTRADAANKRVEQLFGVCLQLLTEVFYGVDRESRAEVAIKRTRIHDLSAADVEGLSQVCGVAQLVQAFAPAASHVLVCSRKLIS